MMEEEAKLDIGAPLVQEDYCDSNPEFAVICSFIVQFGDKIDLELNIEQLKSSIENQSELDDSLLDLHVKLLKKIRRYFVRDQWEKALIRFTSEYSYEDAYDIERLGYLKCRPSIKLSLLRRLLDAQFECDQKFKASVNLCEADELRTAPIGRDIRGNTYWHRTDKEGSLRIFSEEPLDYTIWKTVCKNNDELNRLIDDLDKIKEEKIKGPPLLEPYNPLPQIFPDLFQKNENPKNNNIVENDVGKSGKERYNKTRKQRSSPLPVLKEVKEEYDNPDGLKTDHNCNAQNSNGISPMTNGTSCPSPTSQNDISVESQVKTTIENLLNKVMLSFEYFIKPLSRTPQEPPVTVNEPVVESKPKKRQTKREKPKEEVLPRRSSSRIQQLQMKKIADQEEELKKLVESKVKPSDTSEDTIKIQTNSRNSKKNFVSYEDDSRDGRKKRRKGQSWRRGKGKKKLSWDQDDSDLSSTSSLSDSNDEFEDAEVTLKYNIDNGDDEFACEEEDTNIEPVIVRRARTARQSLGADGQSDLNTSSVHEEDKPCERCDKSNDPEWILLCDMCDDGYHTSCCVPPLMIVPDGDWFCPPCEHKMLLTKLNELHASILEIIKVKELENKKRQRLRQPNTAPIKNEIEHAAPEELIESSSESILSPSDESFQASSDVSFQASSEPEAETEEDDDEDDVTEVESYNESETSIDELVAAISPWNKKKKTKKKIKRSNYYSDDSDYQPTRGRRAAAARVSYKESTDEEDAELEGTNKKVKKKVSSSGDESHESWKSSPHRAEDSPNSMADSPDTITDSPQPIADLSEPVADLPEPVADLPGPVDDLPEPVDDLPEPVADLPGPVADLPGPVADLPGPLENSTESMIDAPEPMLTDFQPQPVADLPFLKAGPPQPISDSPVHPPFYEDDEIMNQS